MRREAVLLRMPFQSISIPCVILMSVSCSQNLYKFSKAQVRLDIGNMNHTSMSIRTQYGSSPAEAFLNQVEVGTSVQHHPRHASHFVGQTATCAYTDAETSHLLLNFFPHHGMHIWPSARDLDHVARASDRLVQPTSSDKEQDLEDFSSPFHAQDVLQPSPNPLQTFRGWHDPD